METRSSKRKKACFRDETDDVDRISHLPDAVLHQILLLLPIKAIAQTSVLSKRWRSLWFSLPDLDFTTIGLIIPKGIQPFAPSSKLSRKRGPDFINKVLSLRNRHAGVRILRFRAPMTFSHLSGLMRLAVRHSVQELDAEVSTNDYFNFPRCVLTSRSLRVFKLKSSYPGFRLPPSSALQGGFETLSSLSFSLVNLYDHPCLTDFFTDPCFPRLKKLHLDNCFGLKQLRVSCRLLEDFSLENCFQLNGLEVLSSKLERLRVSSCFDAYTFESWVKIDTPKLKSFVWESSSFTVTNSLQNLVCLQEASVGVFLLHQDVNSSKVHSLLSFLSGLSRANRLTLEQDCLEILSSKIGFTRLFHPFHNLRSLELHTRFSRHNVHGLACLFRSSPTLHKLVLIIHNDQHGERRQWNKDLWDMSTSEVEQYWESQTEDLNSFLNHLNVVEIEGFFECENEVSLVIFLLKHGKALIEMTLRSGCVCRDSLRRQTIRSQMLGFSKASSNAKISFQ